MMLPLVAFSWVEFAEGFAAAVATMGLWKKVTSDPIEELTEAVRHPVKFALEHPLKAIRRKIER